MPGRIQRQAIAVAVRQIEMVIDYATVPVDARHRTGDVVDAGQHERDRTGCDDRVVHIVHTDAHALQREVADVEERRQVAGVEEQHALEEQPQAASADGIQRSRGCEDSAEDPA